MSATGWTRSIRSTACRLCWRRLDLDRHGDVDAAVVAYPHGASAPFVAQLRARGVKVVDLSADFRLRDVETYEEWYRPHPEPDLIGQAVYGLPELYRDADLQRRRWSPIRAAIRPPRSSRWRPWRERG